MKKIITLKKNIEFPVKDFMVKCILPCFLVTLLAFILQGVLTIYIHQSIVRFFIVVPISILWTLFCDYFFGLSRSEKELFLSYVQKMILKLKNR